MAKPKFLSALDKDLRNPCDYAWNQKARRSFSIHVIALRPSRNVSLRTTASYGQTRHETHSTMTISWSWKEKNKSRTPRRHSEGTALPFQGAILFRRIFIIRANVIIRWDTLPCLKVRLAAIPRRKEARFPQDSRHSLRLIQTPSSLERESFPGRQWAWVIRADPDRLPPERIIACSRPIS